MRRHRFLVLLLVVLAPVAAAKADFTQRVVDIPTRPGITQRFLLITPEQPRGAAILFAGGHGGLMISDRGTFGWGGGNFLVRSREAFAQQGLVVAVVDAPSDRQHSSHLDGFRQTAKHAADIQALIAWLRRETRLPVWLIGTSRGTQSVAYVATALATMDGPDGIVLTSSILDDDKERAVPEMPLDRLDMPVLVVHHEDDGCNKCLYRQIPRLMSKISKLERNELLTFRGGLDLGNPCNARAHHGFNGIEQDVVSKISGWMESENVRLARKKISIRKN